MRLLFFASVFCIALSATLQAAAPNLVNFQGELTDSLGGTVVDSTYSITFSIYSAPVGGAVLWTETQAVHTDGGLFDVLLGSVTPLNGGAVFGDSSRYLGIQVSGLSEISPRTRLVSVPWSHRVGSVDGATGGTISGGVSIGTNLVNTGQDALVAGFSNTVSGPQASIGGGRYNEVTGGAAVIAGGEHNYAPGSYTVISGGAGNETDGRLSAIGGGDTNRVYSNGYASVISGGRQNETRDTCSMIGGGSNNIARGRYSVVSGGLTNTADSAYATVAGGDQNAAAAIEASVGGGHHNIATGVASTIAGGYDNIASGSRASVSGGVSNQATGSYSSIPGGFGNLASGTYSFAAGLFARALHKGCFVWHDGSGDITHNSSDSNQFVVYATGDILFYGSPIKSKFGAGPNTSVVAGSYFVDNSIVAWGKVSGGNGATSGNEFGVASVVRNSAGNYTITVDATASAAANLIPVANAEIDVAPNSAATMRFVSINQVTTNSFDVYINNGTFTPTDNDFVFMVTAR